MDPEPSAGGKEVVIRRGHLITLSVNFEENYPRTSNEYVKTPDPTVEEPGPHNHLPVEMELRDVALCNGAYFGAFCNHRPDLPLNFEEEACACLVRFHGQPPPVEGQDERICFEFPIIAKGCEKYQKYEYVSSCAFLVSNSTKGSHWAG